MGARQRPVVLKPWREIPKDNVDFACYSIIEESEEEESEVSDESESESESEFIKKK